MAKEPVAGRVKTRLCPPLTPDLAARCHEAFVADTLRRVGAVVQGMAERQLAISRSGEGGAGLHALAVASAWRCVDQEGEDLGARMHGLLADAVATGSSVVLLGSDSPDLPLDIVPKAFLALERTDVVLGPARDGGYYLIGCRGRVPDVFRDGMRWGSPYVFSDTMTRLAGGGMTPCVLDAWHDVDDWAGLVALATRVSSSPEVAARLAPEATMTLLAELKGQGFAL